MASRKAALVAICTLVAFTALASPAAPVAAQESIPVGDTWFCDPMWQDGVCPAIIPDGTTITWDFSSASLTHTVTDCGASCESPTASPAFDSGAVSGGTFSHTFDTAGTYLYHCEVHPQQMRGQIFVAGPDTPGPPTITPTVDALPVLTATPTTTGQATGLPSTGSRPDDSDGSIAWAVLGGVLGFALLGVAGALFARRRRT
jgi:hypothetical protein